MDGSATIRVMVRVGLRVRVRVRVRKFRLIDLGLRFGIQSGCTLLRVGSI